MNRRGFLALLGAAAAAPLVPMPELDLGRRIFLPPRGGWALNQLLTVDYIRAEALRILDENLRFTGSFDIGRGYVVGRHDVIIGNEQIGVDHIITAEHPEPVARRESLVLLSNEITHRGLSSINIRKPPLFRRP